MTGRAIGWCSLALALAVLPACKKHAELTVPQYPGSLQVAGFGPEESEAGTLFHIRRATADGLRTVTAYYRAELVEKLGWTDARGLGPSFSDGNMKAENPVTGTGQGEALDPTLPGGYVMIYEGREGTYIELWQWVPKG